MPLVIRLVGAFGSFGEAHSEGSFGGVNVAQDRAVCKCITRSTACNENNPRDDTIWRDAAGCGRAPRFVQMPPTPLSAIFDDPANTWLAVGAAMFVLAYFILRPMAKRKRDPLSKMDTSGGSMARQRSVEREMSNLLVELSEMARQVTAQLDTRATKLELLMKDADEKIEALRQLSANTLMSTHPSAPSGPFRQSTAEHEALMQPLDTAAPQSIEPQIDPRHAEIYAWADQGRTPREIASQLGRPSGEIELILALRQ